MKLRFEGKYVDGPNAGLVIKGTKSDNYELELKVKLPSDTDEASSRITHLR